MKHKNLLLTITIVLAVTAVSCNDFLDTLPDKRAELSTPDKIADILVSAYPTELPTLMFEIMSDNTLDNGPLYSAYSRTVEQAYHYEDVTDPDWDTPTRVWQLSYKNIASANQALLAIEKLGNPEETRGTKAEALLCRAFGHFVLANTFCIAYNPETSDTDMGIPYMETPETTVKPVYERKTVAYVYEKINADIEAALPLLEDQFTQPKYHFNRRAAYAFAARFNLYYGQWEKVVAYATEAIGNDPRELLRDAAPYLNFSSVQDRMYAYLNKDAACNFMLLSQRSFWGRAYASPSRFAHSRAAAYNTIWQYFPWVGVANGYSSVFGNDQGNYYPKCREIFEYTNQAAGIGQPHIVLVPFTAEESLACRAEAYAMLRNYDEAARDLSYWYWRNTADNQTFTKEEISEYYSITRNRSVRYPMDSHFNIEPGMQENLVRAALAIRRLDGIHTGLRWPDIKRHGITVKHPVLRSQTEADTLTITPYDKRTAIQLPADVVFAGLPANPR